MPQKNHLAEIGVLGQAYTLGLRSYHRLFETTQASPDHPVRVQQRVEKDPDGPTDRDLARAMACETEWIRGQAKQLTKGRAKEVKPLVRRALDNDDKPTVLKYRRELSKARAAVRDELKKKGGITVGLNNPVVGERSATRGLFILCLGFEEQELRQSERIFARWDDWLAGRAITDENVAAYLATAAMSEPKRQEAERILRGVVKGFAQAEQEMTAP